VIASVPPRITPPLFLCCICIPLDIKVPPLKEVIAFLPQSPGSIVPANQGLLLLNVCAYDAPPLPLPPPSNGQISPHNITRCCLVAPPADNIVLFDNIVPPELIVVLFACPPHFEDIPNIYSYSAPPASKSICALSMRPPLHNIFIVACGRSNSMWKRKRPWPPFNVFTQNMKKRRRAIRIIPEMMACVRASSAPIRSEAMHLLAMRRWTEQGWLKLG
jgi:hypothetical protein